MDWVRYEIATALRGGITVIPVLLDDARLPTARELPDDIAELAMRQVCYVRSCSLAEDCDQLADAVAAALATAS